MPRLGPLKTDSELKGRWTDPPAEKWPFFGVLELRRTGASRCLSVAPGCASVDSTKKKSRNFFLARLGWFSVTDVIPDFGNATKLGCNNKGRRGFVLYVKQGPQIHSLFCCCTPTSPRTAALKFDHCFSSGSVRCRPPLRRGAPRSTCWSKHRGTGGVSLRCLLSACLLPALLCCPPLPLPRPPPPLYPKEGLGLSHCSALFAACFYRLGGFSGQVRS